MKKNNLEKFKMRTVRRSEVALADYNPRKITPAARERLKAALTSPIGQIAPLVWNQMSGTLVGGHARISILDEVNGYPDDDYELTVAVVSLDAIEEREANILLNNREVQGSWDFDALAEMASQWQLDAERMGFDIEESWWEEAKEEPTPKKVKDTPQQPKKVGCEVVIHFEDEDERESFLETLGLPGRNRFGGDEFVQFVREL